MAFVSTTAFITHCWKNAWLRTLGLLLTGLICGTGALLAQTAAGAALHVMQAALLERDHAVLLEARMTLEPSEAVKDALHKGIPVFFMAHARILRPRWYWTDAVVAEVHRYYRLSYQPLTDRWRLSIGSERPQPGVGLTLGQNFNSLDDALNVMRRVVDWRVGERGDFKTGDLYDVEFGFQLDVSQLPRPLQIGMSRLDDWHMEAVAGFRWSPDGQPATSQAEAGAAALQPAAEGPP
jgi:hypothetical protein